MDPPFDWTSGNRQHLVISRAADAISTELDGETVILNIGTGIYSGLDRVGTTIWNALEKPASFVSLTALVMDHYEVSQERCIADLRAFLDDLLHNSLIVMEDEQTG